MSTFILAFDHRNSLLTTFFGVAGEPTDAQVAAAREVKRVIADGLLAAIERSLVGTDEAGALVDATYGADAIDRLQDAGVRVAVPVEASGRREFAFEHADWRERLDATHPAWAKVLVRYNPDGDTAMNERQRHRLLDLQTVARAIGVGFLFELLVPPEAGQRGPEYDTEIRPGLVVRSLEELRAAGITPDLWKIEGLDRREDCARVAAVAGAPCVVLGRGADTAAVERWLRAGAGVPGFDGFAIGRSIWWDPVRAYMDGGTDRAAAVTAVADRYGHYVDVYRDATR
jgi:myo-inositol catabolism protein IolC